MLPSSNYQLRDSLPLLLFLGTREDQSLLSLEFLFFACSCVVLFLVLSFSTFVLLFRLQSFVFFFPYHIHAFFLFLQKSQEQSFFFSASQSQVHLYPSGNHTTYRVISVISPLALIVSQTLQAHYHSGNHTIVAPTLGAHYNSGIHIVDCSSSVTSPLVP